MKINFQDLGMPVFTGRTRGAEARKRLGLDGVSEDMVVEISIPDDTYAITSSYFLGLFGPSVRRAGSKDAFLAHFKFKGPEHILETLDDLVTRALRDQKELF